MKNKRFVLIAIVSLLVMMNMPVWAAEVIGINFVREWPNPHLAGEVADGMDNWTDSVAEGQSGGNNGSGLILSGTDGKVTCSWSSVNLYSAGEEASGDQQLYRDYLDDGGDGPIIRIQGLDTWMASEGFTAYRLRIYQNTDWNNAVFPPIYVYRDYGTIKNGGTVLATVQSDNMWGDDGGTRASVDTGSLSAGTVTIDTAARDMDNRVRSTVAGIKITGVVDPYFGINPEPADRTETGGGVVLRWGQDSAVAGEWLRYDVYFGDDNDPASDGYYGNTAVKVVSSDSDEYYYELPEQLEPGKQYYWRVDTREIDGTRHEGPEWTFIAGVGFWESFEDFPGKSWWTVNEFAGDAESGSWSGNNKTMVMVEDGTVFSGRNYLKIWDNDSGDSVASKEFTPAIRMGFGRKRFTFAMRRQHVPEQTAAMTGLSLGFTVGQSGDPEGENVTILGQDLLNDLPAIENGVWTTWQMDIDLDEENRVCLKSLVVTNTKSKDIIYSNENWQTSVVLDDGYDTLAGFYFSTDEAEEGIVDIDAIRLGYLEEQVVESYRPCMPYRAYYGAGLDHHEMTLAVPNSIDERLLEDHGISPLWWAYGTQIGWEAGAEYWYNYCDASRRIRKADLRYPYSYRIPGCALDEWIGYNFDEVHQWIYDGLTTGKADNPDVFVSLWANGWKEQEMYDLTLNNTIDLIMTEGYTMNPYGGAGGAWTDAIREMEECAQMGLERKTVVGLGSITDLPNNGDTEPYWTESRFRYFMEYVKEEYPKCPGVAFFPADVGDEQAYKDVLDLAGRMAKEYWPDNWLPDGVYAITPQVKTTMRVEACEGGKTNGTEVKAKRSSYPGDMTAQQWRFRAYEDGVYRIEPSYTSAVCLDARAACDDEDAHVLLWQTSNRDSQRWRISRDRSGFRLEPLCAPGKYLKMDDDIDGSKFTLSDKQDDRRQLFSITPEICALDPIAPYYQAEDGVLSGGTIYSSGTYGHMGGYVNFPSYSGGRVTLQNVDGLDGGEKMLIIRYASDFPNTRIISLTVNGVTTMVALPPTESWHLWRRRRVRVELNPGKTNTIALTSNATGDPGDVDKITIEPIDVGPLSVVGDFDDDYDVDMEDLSAFMTHWLEDDCNSGNLWCFGIDMDFSGSVDFDDWLMFTENWQVGK